MAYRDPYASNHNYSYNNEGYSEPYYSQPNPSTTYPPYDANGYRSETSSRPIITQQDSSFTGVDGVEKRRTQGSFVEPPKDTGDLRLWRHDTHGNLWTKGGRGSCIGRFCCCTILITLFLVISIALALAMWLRPPDISFGSIGPPTSGSAIEASASELKINLALPISVKNPNFFSASFRSISATAYYPTNDVNVGGGERDNIVFAANSETTFNFPISIDYTQAKDPNSAILTDIASRCGFTGSAKKQIMVKYTITLKINILAITVSPSFSGQAGFDCPLSQAQIQPFLGSVNLGGSGS